MKQAPLPPNEAERLATLRALCILDTPREERFDRLTRLARRMFGVPIAAISLVDAERQWFKSCMGLAAREAPRAYSFCAHAILSDAPLVIGDTHADPRFEDNPLVVDEPWVRFYAGQPIKADNGCRLGTLALIDHDPRGLDAEALETLRDLALMVERELLLMHPVTTDALTGITNRRGFLAMGRRCLSQCIRHGYPAAVILFALDRSTPEAAVAAEPDIELSLTTFAESMKQGFRESDLFARLEPDEFALLLSHTDAEGAAACAQRFADRVARENASLPSAAQIRFFWQVAAFEPSHHNTVEALLAEAHKALQRRRHRASPA